MTLHFRTPRHGPAATDGPWAGGQSPHLGSAPDRIARLARTDLGRPAGHGRSAPLAGRQTVEAYADALAGFVHSQRLTTADLVGSSVGGRLVLEMARRGIGRHCVALDPGGFWRGGKRVGCTGRSRHRYAWCGCWGPCIPACRAMPSPVRAVAGPTFCASVGAAATACRRELQSLADTPVFDAMLRELARGPLQQGSAKTPGLVTIGWGRQDHPATAAPGCTRAGSLPVSPSALVRALRPLPALGSACRDGARDP